MNQTNEISNPLHDYLLGVNSNSVEQEDFYKTSDFVPLGCKRPYDHYENKQELIKNTVQLKINKKRVFNYLFVSRAGTHKTWTIKRLMAYYHHHNYNMVCFDVKGDSLIDCKKLGNRIRFYPTEKPIKLPVEIWMPTYVSCQNYGMSLSEDLILTADKHFTLDLNEFDSAEEWTTLLKTTGAAAPNEVIDAMKEIRQSMIKIYKSRGIYKKPKIRSVQRLLDVLDKKFMHPASKQTINNRLKTFITHEVFNMSSQKISDKRMIYPTLINLKEIWRRGKIPVISFYNNDDPEYRKMVINSILKQEWRINANKPSHLKIPILNIFDDCQLYFDKTPNNIANINVTKTINLGRSCLLNNIFAVQDPEEFYPPLLKACKDKFFSSLDKVNFLSASYDKVVLNFIKSCRLKSNPHKFNHCWAYVPDYWEDSSYYYPFGSPTFHDLSG